VVVAVVVPENTKGERAGRATRRKPQLDMPTMSCTHSIHHREHTAEHWCTKSTKPSCKISQRSMRCGFLYALIYIRECSRRRCSQIHNLINKQPRVDSGVRVHCLLQILCPSARADSDTKEDKGQTKREYSVKISALLCFIQRDKG
jgi:hypothetical protein